MAYNLRFGEYLRCIVDADVRDERTCLGIEDGDADLRSRNSGQAQDAFVADGGLAGQFAPLSVDVGFDLK